MISAKVDTMSDVINDNKCNNLAQRGMTFKNRDFINIDKILYLNIFYLINVFLNIKLNVLWDL